MREIMFRALRDDMSDCSFVYGCLVYDEAGNPKILSDQKQMLFTSCIKGTEGQFTGLRDKNGKEIYEGDIVKLHDAVGDRWLAKIAIEDGCANAVYLEPRFNRSAGIVARFRDYVKCFAVNHAIEVIGNIHESPELLTEHA